MRVVSDQKLNTEGTLMAIVSNMYNPNRINLGERIPLSTPLVIQLEASGYCNLECEFCPCGDENARKYLKQDIMSLELFEKFVDQCKEFEEPIKVLRVIGIGEPLLNKNVSTFVRIAKESGAFERVEITTNGILLSKDLSDSLIENGLDTLLVSLEATSNEKFFEIAKRNIDVQKIKENLSYFYKKSRDTITKLYIKTVNVAIDDSKAFLGEYSQICDYIYVENIIENWPGLGHEIKKDAVRYEETVYLTKKKVCIQPFKLLCVSANGDVVPCCVDWKRELKIGNIKEMPIKKIWNGDALRGIMKGLLKQKPYDICKKCKYRLQNQPDDIDDYIDDIICRMDFK